MARAIELILDHGGRRHPDESGALAWRTAFIRMPYARELTVPLGVIDDTFESAVTWDKFEDFHGAVSAATAEALKEATGRSRNRLDPFHSCLSRRARALLHIQGIRHVRPTRRTVAAHQGPRLGCVARGGRNHHPPSRRRSRSHALVSRAAPRPVRQGTRGGQERARPRRHPQSRSSCSLPNRPAARKRPRPMPGRSVTARVADSCLPQTADMNFDCR